MTLFLLIICSVHLLFISFPSGLLFIFFFSLFPFFYVKWNAFDDATKNRPLIAFIHPRFLSLSIFLLRQEVERRCDGLNEVFDLWWWSNEMSFFTNIGRKKYQVKSSLLLVFFIACFIRCQIHKILISLDLNERSYLVVTKTELLMFDELTWLQVSKQYLVCPQFNDLS